MKIWKILDRVFMILGFMTAFASVILSINNNKPYEWQLACLAWIMIAYLKQLTIEGYEDEQ
jgi:hypothetical protein